MCLPWETVSVMMLCSMIGGAVLLLWLSRSKD